jgi:hypothetical protein
LNRPNTITKTISLLFLAALLVSGTVIAIFQSSTLLSPFMTKVHAQTESGLMYDNNYNSKYSLFEKGNVDCNNFNLNDNRLNVNAIPESLRSLIASKTQPEDALAEVEGTDRGTGKYGNHGEKRFDSYWDIKDFVYKCVNENTNRQILQSNLTTQQTQSTTFNVYLVWEDDSLGNYEIFFASSLDGGLTYSSPKNLSNNTGSSIHPQITSEGNNVYVVWKDNTPSNNDIFFTVSHDGGENFSTPDSITKLVQFEVPKFQ